MSQRKRQHKAKKLTTNKNKSFIVWIQLHGQMGSFLKCFPVRSMVTINWIVKMVCICVWANLLYANSIIFYFTVLQDRAVTLHLVLKRKGAISGPISTSA